MPLKIEQCDIKLTWPGPPAPCPEVWQQKFCRLVISAVYDLIREACGTNSTTPISSVCLPDLSLNLPPVDYARFERTPLAYLHDAVIPALRDQLAPTLAASQPSSISASSSSEYVMTPSQTHLPASPTASDSQSSSTPSSSAWSEIEAALVFGQGTLAAANDELVAALLRALAADSPSPLRHWLLLPPVRHRLWSALRRSGWAVRMPEVLQALFHTSQVEPLLPSLLTQGLTPSSQFALWEAALSVLHSLPPRGQANAANVLYVQSFALLNHASLPDARLRHRLLPLRRWLAATPEAIPGGIQSWFAITRLQGVRDRDLAGLDKLLTNIIPLSLSSPDSGSALSTVSVASVDTWRTLLSRLVGLRTCADQTDACLSQAQATLAWLNTCHPPLDPAAVHPVVVALRRLVTELSEVPTHGHPSPPTTAEIYVGAHSHAPVPAADEAAETNAGTHHHASAPPTDEVAKTYVGAHGRAPVPTLDAPAPAVKESLALLSGIQQRAHKRLEDCQLPEAIQRVQDVIALSEQVQAKQQDAGWACQDAGLVLLWPHLKTLFSRLKLLDADSAFVDDAAQRKAQALLIALLGTEPCAEVWCVANILIGLPADTLVFEPVPLSPDELNQCDQLLSAVIAQWSALKQMSVPAFRDLFLLRTGVLRPDDQGLRLEVKKHPADVLLSKLPWGIGIIALPWLPGKLLRVDWSDGLS